jgi:hypothetical protein
MLTSKHNGRANSAQARRPTPQKTRRPSADQDRLSAKRSQTNTNAVHAQRSHKQLTYCVTQDAVSIPRRERQDKKCLKKIQIQTSVALVVSPRKHCNRSESEFARLIVRKKRPEMKERQRYKYFTPRRAKVSHVSTRLFPVRSRHTAECFVLCILSR